MKREEYIEMRNDDSLEPIYEAYKEGWKAEREKFMLNFEEFVSFFRIWPEAQQVYFNIMSYYDIKFTIIKLEDLKTGNIIKYY